MMHIQQQQQQQQLLSGQNGALFGSQTMFMQPPMTTGSVTPSESMLSVYSGQSKDREAITHTHPFNGPLSGTTRVSRYQKGKTTLDFTEARDSEWQWNLLGHMQVCTSLQT